LTACLRTPNNISSGIYHVAHAHMINVALTINGRIDCRNGSELGFKISGNPALDLIAATPITTHRGALRYCVIFGGAGPTG
jgi:hypothetical protein